MVYHKGAHFIILVLNGQGLSKQKIVKQKDIIE